MQDACRLLVNKGESKAIKSMGGWGIAMINVADKIEWRIISTVIIPRPFCKMHN